MFRRLDVTEPNDLVILHKERYEYPDSTDGGKLKVTRNYTRNTFYCCNVKCVKPRHPYFWNGRVNITKEVKQRLSAIHKAFRQEKLHIHV
jgi:hypothetical protein